MPYPFAKMRQALLRGLRGLPERYTDGSIERKDFPDGLDGAVEFSKGKWFWAVFRNSWDNIVRTRSCVAFGVQLVWSGRRDL